MPSMRLGDDLTDQGLQGQRAHDDDRHRSSCHPRNDNTDSSPLAITPTKLKRHQGGLKHLERLLGLRQDQVLPTDAVFISLDSEVTSDPQILRPSGDKPIIAQLGFAYLDTRDLHLLSSSSDMSSLISVRMFQVTGLSLSKTAQSKGKKKCIFAEAHKITPEVVPATITQNLRVQDEIHKDQDQPLRNIILVGQSILEDLKVIQLLGINIFKATPILTAVDTHLIARHILPPYNPNIFLQPGQDFSLAGVLSTLGCKINPLLFHNAVNDAVHFFICNAPPGY
ncbi:hypothetical protein V8C37DRAFT_377002 [Trichoderma ceciliae]